MGPRCEKELKKPEKLEKYEEPEKLEKLEEHEKRLLKKWWNGDSGQQGIVVTHRIRCLPGSLPAEDGKKRIR